jgi:hypothetical protein
VFEGEQVGLEVVEAREREVAWQVPLTVVERPGIEYRTALGGGLGDYVEGARRWVGVRVDVGEEVAGGKVGEE